MKRFSAQYIFTNAGPPLKRGIITADDDGTVTGIEDTMGNLVEKESIEFHNGIIIPGFVNCHCHLELSHMKGMIPPGNGLAEFLNDFRNKRETGAENIPSCIYKADNEMFSDGVVLCADICNSRLTFDVKKKSRIKYISLLETFEIDPDKAEHAINKIIRLNNIANDYGLPSWIVPHSTYSVSLSLFSLLRTETVSNKITSIHFMETESEKIFLKFHEGPILKCFKESGLKTENLETVEDHASAVLKEITLSGNLILVHNTYVDRSTIKKVKKRENTYWCLCPNSNLHIEAHVPPLDLLIEEDCRIVTGTDSLAANNRLSILEELKTIHRFFPSVPLQDLILWATLNGASALGEEAAFGSIQPGKKPGLLLLQDVDLNKLQLLPESRITRLL